MTLKKIAIIPARSGSKGLPNKNILMLLDKPLIAYSIEAAIESGVFERVIVSTDSLEYARISEQYGAEVLMRSPELASDTASSYMVIEDVLKRTNAKPKDSFVLLQPTSPFRTSAHIQEAVSLFDSSDAKFSVSMVESEKSSSLIKPLNEGTLSEFDIDFSNYRRQDSKEYTPNGAIFIAENEAYQRKKHFFGASSLAYVMGKEDSVDIDDALDFEFAITIATKRKKSQVLLDSIKNRIETKKKDMTSEKDITLLGHSLFDYWNVEFLSNQSVNNLGIAGISTKEYLELILEKKLIKCIGNKVVLFAGTNDVVINGWRKEDTLKWIKQSIKLIKLINSNAEIYLFEVPLIRGRIDRNNSVINELNQFLISELEGDVNWIGLNEHFSDEFGCLRSEYTSDGLHFTDLAYEKLTAIVERYV
ncbi:acylneuraminate cytidylyltransferase [Photobacterium proteolyticum]|uniref:Acylneuraminate cytidylyltransferase n=1 Tax=Photobacterium proteolyticum TaxID=1903952 RepID=A0A1Q9GNA4_9GAMM|nr:GDSL-type esterase/lipase family protein [Photobacterium proteolyticum]OLQ76076.1 acylneuraminate cytidylyltransferase [Photobacterium proteolyticum]